MITQAEQDQVIRAIWKGNTTVHNPPLDVYEDTLGSLGKSVSKGFNNPDIEAKEALLNNVNRFSAAKTYHQTKDMSDLVFDAEGFIRPFNEFKDDADVVFDTYNKNWLKTENRMAVAQAQSAAQWQDIQDDFEDLPMLQYQTADDERVRHVHEQWDNVVKHVSDPWWDTHMPPNGWGCRCTVIQLSLDESPPITPTSDLPQNPDKLFANNVGKKNEIFKEKGKDKHPYFDVPKQHEKLKSNNFNLPVTLPSGKDRRRTKSVDTALSNEKGWINDLTPQEKEAYRVYTSGEQYAQINTSLRFPHVKQRPEVLKNAKILKESLDKAPAYEGTVYRGLEFDREQDFDSFVSQAKKGNLITDKGFMSTSRALDQAQDFTTNTGSSNRVLMTIKGKNGVLIEKMGQQLEEEVLFNANTTLKVTSVKVDAEGVVLITAEEI